MNDITNLVIIGSGPAAWTAAIYAARALLSPVVIAGEQSGGQLMLTTEVENFPGFERGILGPDLMTAMRKQAERFGTQVIDKDAARIDTSEPQHYAPHSRGLRPRVMASQVRGSGVPADFSEEKSGSVRKSDSVFTVATSDDKQEITARTIIIATGASANTLKLPGEDRLMGRGVGTCAVCDAPFYKGKKTIFVIGGGDSAMEDSLALSQFAFRVIVLVRRDALRASAIMQQRIKKAQNIKIWFNSTATELIGDQRLTHVRLTKDNVEQVLPADGLFYAIGHTPATDWLKGSGVKLDEKGYVITGISSPLPTITSLPGIFAAGDCVDPRYKQAITAAGFGCMAALDAQRWLESR